MNIKATLEDLRLREDERNVIIPDKNRVAIQEIVNGLLELEQDALGLEGLLHSFKLDKFEAWNSIPLVLADMIMLEYLEKSLFLLRNQLTEIYKNSILQQLDQSATISYLKTILAENP